MFENLTERLSDSLKKVTGQAKLTEDNIKGTLREVRMALLEADVALPVVKQFIAQVRKRAIGHEVMRSLSPGQAFIKIVNESGRWEHPVVTTLEPFTVFYKAEGYHQDYLQKNPGGYTCHFIRFGSYLT